MDYSITVGKHIDQAHHVLGVNFSDIPDAERIGF